MNPYKMAVEVEGLPHDTLCQHDSSLPLFNDHVKLKDGGEYQQYRYKHGSPINPGMVVESIKPTENSDTGSSGELVPPPYIDGTAQQYIDGINLHGLSTFRHGHLDDHVYESPP